MAQLFLIQNQIESYPVPIKKLIRKYTKLKHFRSKQVLSFAHEKGFSIPEDDGSYTTYINADLPGGMDTFTYAHELAHIYLKHHELYDIETLTDQEYWYLDREANIFASCLLIPEKILKHEIQKLSQKLSIRALARLKDLFNVSWQTLIFRLDELQLCSKKLTQFLFDQYDKTNDASYYLKNFCTSAHSRRRTMVLKAFKTPGVDSNMRFISCPSCGNHIFSSDAKHCKRCGERLFNPCANHPKQQSSCGKLNVMDSLFCECCGAQTRLGFFYERMQEQAETAATLE